MFEQQIKYLSDILTAAVQLALVTRHHPEYVKPVSYKVTDHYVRLVAVASGRIQLYN